MGFVGTMTSRVIGRRYASVRFYRTRIAGFLIDDDRSIPLVRIRGCCYDEICSWVSIFLACIVLRHHCEFVCLQREWQWTDLATKLHCDRVWTTLPDDEAYEDIIIWIINKNNNDSNEKCLRRWFRRDPYYRSWCWVKRMIVLHFSRKAAVKDRVWRRRTQHQGVDMIIITIRGECWWIGLGDGDDCGCSSGFGFGFGKIRSSVTPMLWGVVIVLMVHVCLETEFDDVDYNYCVY